MIQTSLTPLHRFDEDVPGHRLIAFNVGYDHALYGLWARGLDDGDTRISPDATAARRGPRGYRAIAVRDGLRTRDLTIEDAPFDLHDLQPLGEDVLVIGARSRRAANGDADANGRIYGADGRFKRAIVLGDGIGALQTARDGAIWTGYFDEGVFGGNGWTTPLGASGLVAWRADGSAGGGEAVYRYHPPAGTHAMTDCYAINVAEEAVWCYYYTDFPLVRIERGRETGVWTPGVQGSHGFAVGGGHALFGGGYGDYDHIQLFALHGDGRSEPVASFAPADEQGRRLPGHHLVGRGDALYLRNAREVYRFDIATALRLLGERTGH